MDNRPRKVNQSLDQHPKFFGLPSDQLVPWAIIVGVSYYLLKVLLQLSWIWVVVVAGWGISSWWLLTGSRSWQFLSKFKNPPNWIRAIVFYHSIKTTSTKRNHHDKYKAKKR